MWNLVDNRHARAPLRRRRSRDRRGDVGFARYTRFGVPAPRWHLGQRGRRRARRGRGPARVARGAARPRAGRAATQLTLRVHARRRSSALDASRSTAARRQGRARRARRRLADDRVRRSSRAARRRREPDRVRDRAAAGKATKLAFAWLRLGAIAPRRPIERSARGGDVRSRRPTRSSSREDAGADLVRHDPRRRAPGRRRRRRPCTVEVARARRATTASPAGCSTATTRASISRAMAGRSSRSSLTARDCPRATIARAADHAARPGADAAADGARRRATSSCG